MSVRTTTFIYTLLDPRTGEIRYVGKADNPKKRLVGHLRQCKRGGSHRAHWLRLLLAEGFNPSLEVIDEVLQSEWAAVECAYVIFYKEQGCDLVNSTPGGEGFGTGANHPLFGRPRPPEVRAKLSAANKGKRLSPEVRAKLMAAHKGKVFSPERCANMSAAQKGKRASVAKRAHLQKLHAANRGRKPTPEQIARQVAAQTGRKHSVETLAKLRAKAVGRVPSTATRAAQIAAMTGSKHTPEHCAKMSAGIKIAWESRRLKSWLAEMWN